MSHSLVEIPYSEWSKLLDLYIHRKKESSGYYLILNYNNWKSKEPDLSAKIYSLDGDWQNDGTFILIDDEIRPLKTFFNTLSDNFERLRIALNCLDTTVPYLFFGMPERNLPVLRRFCIDMGFKVEDTPIDGTFWYHIEKEKAVKFDIKPPQGITLSPLKLEHANTVNDVWPHRADGTVAFVTRLIKSNDSVGAFDNDGNLLAWCLRLPIGSLGLLQVSKTHERQGLGSLVVRNMAHLIASKDEEVLAPVIFENLASRAMFEKLGFKGIGKVYWSLTPAK